MGAPAIPPGLTDEELLKLTLEAPESADVETDAVLVLDGKPLPADPEL